MNHTSMITDGRSHQQIMKEPLTDHHVMPGVEKKSPRVKEAACLSFLIAASWTLLLKTNNS